MAEFSHAGAWLRDEALLMLEGRGALLDVARDVSRLLRDSRIDGAVVGGVAVVLHGHLRTTRDVDVLVEGDLPGFRDALIAAGFAFDPDRREFSRRGVPVHLVLEQQVGPRSDPVVEIEGIVTLSLTDLIAVKLRSGTTNLLRAQDLADVIGLIRCNRLGLSFAVKLPKDLRPEFRKLARAIEREV